MALQSAGFAFAAAPELPHRNHAYVVVISAGYPVQVPAVAVYAPSLEGVNVGAVPATGRERTSGVVFESETTLPAAFAATTPRRKYLPKSSLVGM
jgi:hypothetical protein